MPDEQECLTLIGTASIQQYLFRSNRLKENAGASWLVADALSRWGREPLSQRYEKKIFIGGGNAALIFKDDNTAREAIWEWTLNLCRAAASDSELPQPAAPGLRVLAVHERFSPGSLKEAFKRAHSALLLRENRAPLGWELGALPIVRPCASTGLAAADFADHQWLSAESAAKRRIADRTKTEMQSRYSVALDAGKFEFPDELDKLVGSSEGASQIAIVHADGNGIGQILQRVVDDADGDDDLISKYDGASRAISTLAQDAFRETLLDLTMALPKLKKKGIDAAEKSYPLRPIVDGGDDLTFVCHGRLGLSLAVRYLKHFERESRKHPKLLNEDTPLTACAGVMIVPGKFPFARAYQLAEQLSTNAKRARKNNNGAGSWIDFQVVMDGVQSIIAQSREDWYRQESRWLIHRPYCIGLTGVLGWDSFESKWREFASNRWPRSRAKRLMEALARGEEATAELMAEWQSRVPALDVPWRVTYEKGRGNISRTPYFDPLEMLDFHLDSSLFERGAE